jgi:hypothetical protein
MGNFTCLRDFGKSSLLVHTYHFYARDLDCSRPFSTLLARILCPTTLILLRFARLNLEGSRSFASLCRISSALLENRHAFPELVRWTHFTFGALLALDQALRWLLATLNQVLA